MRISSSNLGFILRSQWYCGIRKEFFVISDIARIQDSLEATKLQLLRFGTNTESHT